MSRLLPKLGLKFFRTQEGREPVRDWLRALPPSERKIVGEEIRMVQFGWPIGMPLVRKLDSRLWEIRVHLPNRIARVFFTVLDSHAVLVHAMLKKTQKTPIEELETARQRISKLYRDNAGQVNG